MLRSVSIYVGIYAHTGALCKHRTIRLCVCVEVGWLNRFLNAGLHHSIYGPSWESWWRHQMEIFSALLAICAGNSPVTGEFPTQRPVTRSFDVYFDLRPNERLSKQSWGWWFETLSRSLWRHRNDELSQLQCVSIHIPGWLLKWQRTRFSHINSKQVFHKSMLSVGEVTLKNELHWEHKMCNFGQKYILFSYYIIFRPNCMKNIFKLKFDSCQTLMHQNILLWPWCTQAAGIRLGNEGKCRYEKKTPVTWFLNW